VDTHPLAAPANAATLLEPNDKEVSKIVEMHVSVIRPTEENFDILFSNLAQRPVALDMPALHFLA
jgi:hypothetical protein